MFTSNPTTRTSEEKKKELIIILVLNFVYFKINLKALTVDFNKFSKGYFDRYINL